MKGISQRANQGTFSHIKYIEAKSQERVAQNQNCETQRQKGATESQQSISENKQGIAKSSYFYLKVSNL